MPWHALGTGVLACCCRPHGGSLWQQCRTAGARLELDPVAGGTPPAEPAVAGAPSTAPVGKVVTIGPAPEGIVIGRSGTGAVAVRNPDGVELFDAATGVVGRRIPTEGAARHLRLAGPDGPVVVPLEGSNELVQLDLAQGTVFETATGVGHQPHDAARTAEGTIVVTNELGGGVVFVRDGSVIGSARAGPVQPGGIAAVGRYAAVADVRRNGVWVYDPSTQQLASHGPVGVKLTHAVGLSGDLGAFADTDGARSSSSASTRRSLRSPGSTPQVAHMVWPTTRTAVGCTSHSPRRTCCA